MVLTIITVLCFGQSRHAHIQPHSHGPTSEILSILFCLLAGYHRPPLFSSNEANGSAEFQGTRKYSVIPGKARLVSLDSFGVIFENITYKKTT